MIVLAGEMWLRNNDYGWSGIIKFSSLDRVTGGLESLKFPPWIELLVVWNH